MMKVAEFNALSYDSRRELIQSHIDRGLCAADRPKLWAYKVLDKEFSPTVYYTAVQCIVAGLGYHPNGST